MSCTEGRGVTGKCRGRGAHHEHGAGLWEGKPRAHAGLEFKPRTPEGRASLPPWWRRD